MIFRDSQTARERERAFLIGAPLALIPALSFLPAITFLIAFPRLPHGRLMGSILLPICALVGGIGLWKVAMEQSKNPGVFSIF